MRARVSDLRRVETLLNLRHGWANRSKPAVSIGVGNRPGYAGKGRVMEITDCDDTLYICHGPNLYSRTDGPTLPENRL